MFFGVQFIKIFQMLYNKKYCFKNLFLFLPPPTKKSWYEPNRGSKIVIRTESWVWCIVTALFLTEKEDEKMIIKLSTLSNSNQLSADSAASSPGDKLLLVAVDHCVTLPQCSQCQTLLGIYSHLKSNTPLLASCGREGQPSGWRVNWDNGLLIKRWGLPMKDANVWWRLCVLKE